MPTTADLLIDQSVALANHLRQQSRLLCADTERSHPMKISEMTTASFADFVCAAGDHLCSIMQNDSVAALFASTEKKNPLRWIADAAKVLCGPCREDVFAVIGAMQGKSADEIARQNSLVTLGQLRCIYDDLKSADIPD